MGYLQNLFERYGAIVTLINLGMIFLSLILFVINGVRIRRLAKLFCGCDNKSMEDILVQLIQEANINRAEIEKIAAIANEDQIKTNRALQQWGLVRFSAFENIGGDQSFALAMLDNKGNGVVMSSIFGREESRIYCKAIEDGKSNYTLSKEEKEAIEKALIQYEDHKNK